MSRRDYGGAPGTEEEDDLVARSREWMNRNKRDRDWMRSVDDFLDMKGGRSRTRSRSRSRSRSPRSRTVSRSRSRSRDRRDRRDSDRGSVESDDSGDYRRFLGERNSSGSSWREDRYRRRDHHQDWNTEEDYYHHYDDRDDRCGDDGDWHTRDSWEDDNDSNANSEYEYRRYGNHLMELTNGEDRFAYRNQQPQKTIVVRGLPLHITEADIRADIINCGIKFRDIRLVRRKDTGASRGFAFVEFFNREGAQKWIESHQGQLNLKDQARALMQYSFPGKPLNKKPLIQKDWVCRCQAYNFNRRITCYRCNLSRKEGEVEVEPGTEEVSTFPTNTVLLRGLDALTTEEAVLKAIKVLSSLPIRSVRIGHDPVTHAPLCICYIEMNSVVDSVSLHNTLRDSELVIENRRVSVSYAKLAPLGSQSKAPGPRMADAALAAAQWSHQSSSDSTSATQSAQYTLSDVPRLAEYSATLYATNPQEKAAYLKYYEDYYKKQITEGNAVQLGVAGAAAPTVYAAPAVKTTSGPLTEPPDGSGSERYPTPDVSTYQYDKTSGYYYDPYTTLYYDAHSQYYFNSKSSKFLYWDAAKSTYLPAPTAHGSKDSQVPCSSDSDGKSKEDKEKEDEKKKECEKDKIKVAKRIAKDMAKWAKTLNQKKEIAKQNIVAAQQAAAAQAKVAGSADIGYAVLERKELSTSALYNSSVDPSKNSLVAAYSQGSESEEEPEETKQSSVEDKQHVDLVKKVCLLCKRQFPTLEVLQKHIQMSDLHKQNLASWYKSRGMDPSDEDASGKKIHYRDRAKERRLKFGEPETPRPSHLKEQYIKAMESTYEEPTKQGIGSDNLGSKLLQKMGWREGTGLGKSNQGRTDIIQAESRAKSAGLGTKSGSIYTPGPGETYRDCVKKMARMRYNELKD